MGSGLKCGGCALEQTGKGFTKVEIGARYEQTKLLLLGEASGEGEVRESLPFRPYSQGGSLLADTMREVAISRGDVALVDLVRCRPPRDWLEGAPWARNAISNCTINYLTETIHELKPKAILALGPIAFRAVTETIRGRAGTLDYARGYVVNGAGAAEGTPVIGTYHPQFIRRGSPHLTSLFQRDLRRAFLLATGRFREGEHFSTSPHLLNLGYVTGPTIKEAWEYANSVDPDLPLAFDNETPYSTRNDEDERTSFTDRDIKLFQCTQKRGEGIAFPYRDEFVEVVSAILSRAKNKVGFNNWNFDDPVLAANGIEVGGTDDAMIMFHFYQPDLPANLAAAAQYCGFPFPWKHISDSDLEWYGIADVDATLCVYNYMKAVLERAGMWEAYRKYFAEIRKIMRDMSARGIPIDETRRLALKETIRAEDVRVTAEIKEMVPPEILTTKQKGGLKRVPKDTSGLVQIEVKIEKEEKCVCLKKTRNDCPVCLGTGTVPVGSVLKRWAAPKEFNPNSSEQVKRFMRFMKHPVPKSQKKVNAETGEAAETTDVKELERLWTKTKHPIYPLLIQKRQLTKVEGTYVDGWEPGKDGRVHTTYTFQTATWQTSSRAPNVQNGLKHGKTPFQKELARSFNAMQRALPGHILINFDFKSFHALTTAHDFNIPSYARLARIDIHSFVTCHYLKLPERHGLFDLPDEEMAAIFKRLKKDEKFKFTRDFKAKRTILGIQFAMFYRKLYQLNKDDFENETEAKKLWELVMIDLFPQLRTGQDAMREKAAEDKKLVNKFGAIRHFHDVQRWDRRQQKIVSGEQAEAAVAFLPASHAFGHVRAIMLKMRENGWDEKYQLINTIHDSFVFHCPLEFKDECTTNIQALMQAPSDVLIYPEMAPNGLWVETEWATGESLAEVK
jgi:uracil-DNA glycosylase family 4